MSEQKFPLPDADAPKKLSEFLGTPSEQRKAKSDFISKYGFAAYEQLVMRSGPNCR
ncbi:MAG TPA: hypothetical protein VIH78_11805 [Terriglobales bacterium]